MRVIVHLFFLTNCVSILVLVDLAHEFICSRSKVTLVDVSILVLVDLAHEFKTVYQFRQELEFQSLFQWILLTNKLLQVRWGVLQKFQSLFQWILLTNLSGKPASGQQKISFNPCFSGSCSRITQKNYEKHIGRQFQSLFQWILLTNCHQIIYPRCRQCCFNPCFSGSCSRMIRRKAFSGIAYMFQSLFQWILLTNNKGGRFE